MPLTSLRDGNDVVSGENRRDAVRLDGRRVLILTQLNILAHDGVETSVIELCWVSKAV